MKTHTALIICALSVITNFTALAADKGVEIRKTNGESLHFADAQAIALSFDDSNAILTDAAGQTLVIPTDNIAAIAPVEKVASEYTINYSDTKVTVVNPYAFQGVSTEIDGAYVTTTNSNTAEELTFTLSGTTTDGSWTYDAAYKTTMKLNGVDIKSLRGAAIDVKCGKRIAMVLTDGTVNTLEDFATGDQKATLYFKGHPEFEKGGTLNVIGNCNHAIAAKEYVQLKKTVGTINILSAANDGIHAGQYFQMNGGKLNIKNVAGDGVQAELTDDETDEQNGQMIIKGGTITISVSGATADCLKADDLITISGGNLNLTTTGNGIEEATTAILQGPGGGGGNRPGGGPGWGGGSQVETSSPKCINGGGAIEITGGNITTLSTGKGGKGIVCDGTLTIDGDANINCKTTGTCVSGSGDNASGLPKAIKSESDVIINSGTVYCITTGSGGEGLESKARITINGGTVVCNTTDDGINASKKITINGGIVWSWASNNDGMDCNGSEGFEFNGGVVVSNGTSGMEEGFDCDNYTFAINGGTILGVGGKSSSVTRATQPFASTSSVKTTKGTYLSLVDPNGNVILSYLCPVSLSSATVVSSAAEYQNNISCKLVYGATAVDSPSESYLDGRILLGGKLTGGTNKSITPKTK